MPNLVASVTVEPVDHRVLVATVPALLRRIRALSFGADRFLEYDGRRIEGLRNDVGAHPQVGARYTVVLKPTEDEPDPKPLGLDLLADAGDLFSVRFQQESVGGTIAVDRPRDPLSASVEVEASLPADVPYFAGPITGSGLLRLDDVPHRGDEPQVVASLEHRRARGGITVRITEQSDRTWLVTLTLRVQGRGLLRPVVAIAARVWLRSRWQEYVRKLPDEWATIRKDWPTGDPDELAAKLVAEWVDDLAVELPTGVRP
ncbi:hypothetical protein FB561_6043 [Kribbella amoyensis]|uniref:Uncharacterized protein n=1 Tax=Kribbella amoyensis TaxID=996641 RepID=A0A561C1B6_9ACTN|nr:hypothetical protein [Kribbella amoyensis]TWD84847.1 hypothetical protein FB561_6043 [Kribbella amoyensis]